MEEVIGRETKQRLPIVGRVLGGRAEPPRRLSGLLREVATDRSRLRVSIGDLCEVFADRAFGALIFLFAAPNVVPVPIPGISAITGVPLIVLTLQLMLGQKVPWLPGWIRGRSFDRLDLLRMLERVEPWLLRLERYLRPRVAFLLSGPLERLWGALMLVLAVVLFLPIPLGNLLPGLALSLLALAFLERDGAVLLAGAGLAVASLFVVAGVVYGLVTGFVFFLHKAL